jgi:retinitis pigmentosa 9 protein
MKPSDIEQDEILQKLENFVKEGEEEAEVKERPDDCIPDLPENKTAREFLKKAPTQGLVRPLGKEVKVMQCFRCKAYGHRTGDRECPLRELGNILLDAQRQVKEDPMSSMIAENDREQERLEKYERAAQLLELVKEIRDEEKARKEKKKRKRDRRENKEGRNGKERRSGKKKKRD